MKAYNVCHLNLYLDGLIHTWTASSRLRINPRVILKDKILFLISKSNFITEKSNKLKYIKAIFSDLPPDLELELLEQDQSCPAKILT